MSSRQKKDAKEQTENEFEMKRRRRNAEAVALPFSHLAIYILVNKMDWKGGGGKEGAGCNRNGISNASRNSA